MKKGILMLILAALALSVKAQVAADKVQVKKEAEKQIPEWLQKIPEGRETGYGFASRDEFSKAVAGEPLSFYTLIADGLVSSYEYRVPVVIDGEYRALLTLQKTGEAYAGVDFGANGLAVEIQQLLKSTDLSVTGIVRVPGLHSDFLLSKGSDGADVLLPLASAKQYLSSQGIGDIKPLYTAGEIIKMIR